MTEIRDSANFFSNCPRLRRSTRRFKPNIPDTNHQKGSEILKPQHCRKRKRKQKEDETTEPEVVLPSFGRQRLKGRLRSKNEVTYQQERLDTNTFQCYFENLWRSLPDERTNSFAYLDCLWFNLYSKPHSKAKVLTWIKKKQVFSKKYVIVPIVRWDHWSLLIFCHMGESLQSKSPTPCMLLLDSLRNTNPMRLEPGIRKFVLDLYKTEERPENRKQIYGIPLMIPKVPQQRNGVECGNFVLYFIKLFIDGAPEIFSISEGYPYFMKNNWFTYESLDGFCERLISS